MLEVALVALACWVGWLPVALPLLRVTGWRPGRPLAAGDKLKLVVSLYLVIPLVLWAFSVVRGWPLAGLGLHPGPDGWLELLAGFGLGTAGIALLFGFEIAGGWAVLKTAQMGRSLLPILLLALWVGAVEELLFRGYLVQTLAPYGPWGAAVLASIFFALLHLIWEPMADLGRGIFQLPGLFLMGMVLIESRLLAGGSLNLAWGLHAGWVWAITLVDTHGLVRYTDRAPEWLTGIGGKPLAGLLGLAFLTTTAAVLWVLDRV